MKNLQPPGKFYGPALLTLPIGAVFAQTRADQIDALYDAADAPGVTRIHSERLLKLVARLQENY